MVLFLGLLVLGVVAAIGVLVALSTHRSVEVSSLQPPEPQAPPPRADAPPAQLPAKSQLLRQVSDSEIEAQIRSGHFIDAIKLYREKTGAGLKEAKDAVEAWRDRIRAS